LTWIAKKYYGHKDLWVFIYEANHKTIKDPAHIRTGQLLKIPKLTPEQRDLNNPETRKLVDELTKEYLNQ
jgi:phage tail protein X